MLPLQIPELYASVCQHAADFESALERLSPRHYLRAKSQQHSRRRAAQHRLYVSARAQASAFAFKHESELGAAYDPQTERPSCAVRSAQSLLPHQKSDASRSVPGDRCAFEPRKMDVLFAD